jgi:hypothetical protein
MKLFYASLISYFRKSVIVLCLGSLTWSANAQVANYNFSQVLGTYTPITGGTVLASGPNFYDDNTWGSVPIGFSFTYNSTAYTEVSVAANGYVKFGNTLPYCCWYNGISIANETDAVHIFSEDLLGNAATCELSYLTSGTIGNQVFILQWKDWGFYNTGTDEINFQLKLYEGTNIIEFAYSPGTVATAFATPQVGLTGTVTTDFNSRTTASDWTNTTASVANTDQMQFNTGVFPPSGLSYFWTLAPIDMAPIALVTPINNSCYTANETVTIRIQNLGSQAIDFSVNPVTINAASTATNPQVFPPVTVNTGILATNTTQDVIVATGYDMSAPGVYTFTATTTTPGDGNTANDVMIPVTLQLWPPVNATVNPNPVCQGQPAQLSTPPGNIAYTVTSIPYAPLPCTGTPVTLSDDQLSSALPIGFTFDFFGISKTDFYISSNGFISFDPNAGSGCCTGQLLPDPFSPNDVITMVWEDFYPPAGGTISYYTTGSAPNRKLVVCYTNIGHFFNGNNPIDGQIILNEGSNTIEQHITSFNTDGDGVGETMGIENSDGTLAFTVPGRNSTDPWSANNEAWLYTPTVPFTFSWSPVTWLSNPLVYNPIVTPQATGNYTYTVTATDPNSGCTSTSSVTITVVPVPSAPIATNVTRCGIGTVQLSATAVGTGTLEWFDAPVGGNQIGSGSPITSPFLLATDTFYVDEFDGACPGPRTPVIVTITTAAAISTTASQMIICGLPASATVTLNATSSNAGYNYTWTGADLNSTTGPSVTATPNATTTYVVQGDDGTCTAYDTITIQLFAPPVANATSTPPAVCLGQQAVLSTPPGQVTYTVSPIPYAPVTGPLNFVPLNDDELSGALPIGFTFNFYGIDKTDFYISSNGFVSFDPFAGSGCCTGQLLPNPFSPNDLIAISWEDFYPPFGGTIGYFTTGSAPYRRLIIDYSGIGHFSNGNNPITGQIILNETYNTVEIHTTSFSTDNDLFAGETQGIENATGTEGTAVPGRNSTDPWPGQPIVNDAWIFTPVVPYQFIWTPNTWLSTDTVYNPVLTPLATGNYTYTVTVTDVTSGCTSTSSVTVTVVNVPVAPTVSNLTRCGTGTVQLTATAGGPGTLQWFDVPTGGTPFATGSPVTSPIISFTDTFYVEEFDGNCPGPRVSVIVTVTPADTIIATPTSNPMCAGQPITITIASIDPTYSYIWTPTIGLSSATEDTVTANPPFSTLYTINAIDLAGCATSTTVNLVVNPSPVITSVTANPSATCFGVPSQLTANVVAPPDSYIVASIPYAPLACPSNNAVLIPTGFWVAGDEGLTAPIPLGFTFNFFGNNYTDVSISSNGMLQFTPYPAMSTYAPTGPLPYSFGFDPDNIIAVPWGDMDQSQGGTITYGTVGTSPNQKFIVCYTSVPYYNGSTGDGSMTTEVILSENNSIEIHVGSVNTASFNQRAIGIENSSGTVAFTPPGRNTGLWTVNTPEAWLFAPAIPYTFTWTPSASLDNDTIANPLANPTTTTTYTINVFDAFYNCGSSATVTVTVNPPPVVTQTPLSNICIDGSPFALSGGTPTGGNYTGPGVSNNIFYPTAAGVGTHTIVYTYADNQGCVGSDSTTITVNDLPVVTLPTFGDACSGGAPMNLTTGLPIGGTYSGPGVTAGVFNPALVGTGIYGITYTYTDGNGCTNSALRNIVVNDGPIANAGPDALGNTLLIGSASGGTPPYTYIWTPCLDLLNCGSPTPFANPQVNTYYVLYVVDANGCYSTDTVLVTSTVGVSDIPGGNVNLLIYPNPASDVFNVVFPDPSGQAQITIVDYIGQVVYKSGEFITTTVPYEINFGNQPDGIYTIQVKYLDHVFTSKLVLHK